MNAQEFNETSFHKGMKAIVSGEEKEIIGIDFELLLFGFNEDNSITLDWVEIENCELLT